MSVHAHESAAADVTHLSKATGSKLVRIAAVLAVIGLLASVAGFAADSKRFGFAWLTAFTWITTLGLGGLFFVLIHHITKAGWSVGPRRLAEWLSGILPICALLFLPVIFFSHDLFHHWMGEQAKEDPILVGKSGYLNTTFFYIRAVLYFAVWGLLAWRYSKLSREQDVSGDVTLSSKLESLSPVSMLLFGATLTFASFDWLMSLDPHWFSTIFGVYVFAGCVTGSLAVIALLMIGLEKLNVSSRVSTVEHRHDVGKLLFGFIVFWAYIGFSQFFLIWYANIPEETIYFLHRWEHGWKPWSYLLVFGHFWGPFFLLLSRHAKRSMLVLGLGAAWTILMHFVDMYWMVMPTLGSEWHGFSWIDVTPLLLCAGVLAFWLAWRASKDALYPLKDPRLPEAAQLVNL